MKNNADVLKLVGRYEFKDFGSYKYWQIKYLEVNLYEVSYGRIGTVQETYNLDEKKAFSKLKEKIKKGYKKVENQELDFYHQKILLNDVLDSAKNLKPIKKTIKI